jgi:hypothetical protein
VDDFLSAVELATPVFSAFSQKIYTAGALHPALPDLRQEVTLEQRW